MSAETQAMRALIDAVEHQERVEAWLSLPGTKDTTLGLEVNTAVGRACDGHTQVMREIEAVINEPDLTEAIVSMVRERVQRRTAQARAKLNAAQKAAQS
jgi:hypothetical protein